MKLHNDPHESSLDFVIFPEIIVGKEEKDEYPIHSIPKNVLQTKNILLLPELTSTRRSKQL